MNRKYGVFSSSTDPQKLALTVKGLAGLIPAIVLLAKLRGIDLGSEELKQIIDWLAELIVVLGSVGSLIMLIVGAVRKIVMRFY
ncbi:MAG: hypothetical protein AABY22_26755 [Nanoarchaeota archaeon]